MVCRLEYKGDDVNILSPKATDFTPTFVPTMANSASSVVRVILFIFSSFNF